MQLNGIIMKPIIVTHSNESYTQESIHWPGITIPGFPVKPFEADGWYNGYNLLNNKYKAIREKDIKLIARSKVNFL